MNDLTKIIPVAKTLPNTLPNTLTDTLQRPLHDLRISVTDRCNLRCTYCMPREFFDTHHVFLPRAELLSFEEIVRLARSFVALGVQKTGPIVRRTGRAKDTADRRRAAAAPQPRATGRDAR